MSGSFANHTRVSIRRGFTLVELLVVMLIIGVLLAFLLPALTKWRETTRKTWCRTNLHQIGIAMHSYQTDFKGVAVMAGADPYQWGNADGLRPQGRYATADQLWHKEYMTDISIMRCPSIFEHNVVDTNGVHKPSTFVTYSDEQMFGTPWEWGGDDATKAPSETYERAPYWLFGVSVALNPAGPPSFVKIPGAWSGSDPQIYWVRPMQYENTLQVQVQDAAMTAELPPIFPAGIYQSNHAIRAKLRQGGVEVEAWRAEGANALRVDGSVAWYQLPREQKIYDPDNLADHPTFRKFGYEPLRFTIDNHNTIDHDFINIATESSIGGGSSRNGPLMVPNSTTTVRFQASHRGDPAALWKVEKFLGRYEVNFAKPTVGFYDRRQLNWAD